MPADMNMGIGEEEWTAYEDVITRVQSMEEMAVMPIIGLRIVSFTREDGTHFFRALISGSPQLSVLLGLVELTKLDIADWYRYPSIVQIYDQDAEENGDV